ncbi:MAG TPA: cyclic pyranopterin monophosphate synthase MoaC [Deltaproteobacteria bacterium]|nr:cyclic pyranopterin monophosphate synthase MoaC [Deltaproteobacteria bacterium]HIJ40994.1 cyclic pyranopterin monophosphate synthase MoaC [Deltaproteobacteria bacterium]
MSMVDVTEKPIVKRQAEAVGKIILSPQTVIKIKKGEIRKGDPLLIAQVAALQSAKQTSILIPHCHQIPLDSVEVDFNVFEEAIEVRCIVKAQARTGVEMEALVGVSAALNTLWDVVKYLEKDQEGQYPSTMITDIRVVRKEKGKN